MRVPSFPPWAPWYFRISLRQRQWVGQLQNTVIGGCWPSALLSPGSSFRWHGGGVGAGSRARLVPCGLCLVAAPPRPPQSAVPAWHVTQTALATTTDLKATTPGRRRAFFLTAATAALASGPTPTRCGLLCFLPLLPPLGRFQAARVRWPTPSPAVSRGPFLTDFTAVLFRGLCFTRAMLRLGGAQNLGPQRKASDPAGWRLGRLAD